MKNTLKKAGVLIVLMISLSFFTTCQTSNGMVVDIPRLPDKKEFISRDIGTDDPCTGFEVLAKQQAIYIAAIEGYIHRLINQIKVKGLQVIDRNEIPGNGQEVVNEE
jgi:hypothetical protein